jgi:hypothetical protein
MPSAIDSSPAFWFGSILKILLGEAAPFIKLAPKHYEQLRSRIPANSPAHQFLSKATRIDYSIEGVLFEGYNVPCDEKQTRVLLEATKQCCPEIFAHVEHAIRLARGR